MPQIADGTEEDLHDGTMLVTRRSVFSGETYSKVLRITPEQLARWRNGELIQRAMPLLSGSEREFLLTGSTQEEWDAVMKDGEE